jgi:UDP-2,3-diacylglucosamine hydrolase
VNTKKIYFASDFHLGVPTLESSLEREKSICRWLDHIKADAEEIYLVGDIFDFWFEHTYTVPKGFTRLLGKIAELTDSGIKVVFFTGNHDLWMRDYFIKELNVVIHHQPITRVYNNKTFYIGHGDGMGPGDRGYKLLKIVFTSKLCHWLYSRLHPNFSFWFARFTSRRSRITTGDSDEKFLGAEKEWLFLFCRDYLIQNKVDFFIFGHRHLPLELDIDGIAKYTNLGDWIKYRTYAVFDGQNLSLNKFEK